MRALVLLGALALAGSPAPIPDADVQRLVQAWLEAQNTGRFEAYQALYAPRFTGVRRSGARTVQLDRQGWLADRARMFRKAMKVEAKDLQISASATSARVLMQQAWSSASYKDVGPKQLIVVRTADGLRIAREEMLQSRLVGGLATRAAAAEALALADDESVLLSGAPDDAWARGAPRGDGATWAERDVREAALPKALGAWKGKKVRLYGPAGPLCEATIASLVLRAEVVPHFGTVQEWNGQGDGPKRSPAQIAAEVWSMAAGDGHALFGRLSARCPGAVWARAADLPAPAITPVEEPSGSLREAALSAFRRLRAYRDLQAAYGESSEAPAGKRRARWEDADGAKPHVYALGATGGGLVLVSAQAGAGCGRFEGSLVGLWEVRGDASSPKLSPLSLPADEALIVRAAVDLDGDGKPEIVVGPHGMYSERGILRWNGKAYTLDVLHQIPFHDCPC